MAYKESVIMEWTKEVIEVYSASEHENRDRGDGQDSYKIENVRTAKITFKDEKFRKCDYKVRSITEYTLDDWVFLEKVSQKIQELVAEKAW